MRDWSALSGLDGNRAEKAKLRGLCPVFPAIPRLHARLCAQPPPAQHMLPSPQGP